MAPEENEEPIPMREQPLAYRQVRGQRAVRGRGQTQPFHRHLFPHTVHQDRGSSLGVGAWAFAPAKCGRVDECGGDEDRSRSKRRRIEPLDGNDQPSEHRVDQSPEYRQQPPDDPSAGSCSLLDRKWGVGFRGGVGDRGDQLPLGTRAQIPTRNMLGTL